MTAFAHADASPHAAGREACVRPFVAAESRAWDAVVAASEVGTPLASRRFLDYHGDRFCDASLVVEREGRLCAVLPAAWDPCEAGHVVSHPGATHGGLVWSPGASAADVAAWLDGASVVWRGLGARRLTYRPPPPHFQRRPEQLDVHALWLRGAKTARMELWNVIPLDEPLRLTKGHRWSRARARKAGVRVTHEHGPSALADFWYLLRTCLDERHGVAPVHGLAELLDVAERLDAGARLWTARSPAGDLLAATWVLHHPGAHHSQYIASSERGREQGAVVEVLLAAIEAAGAAGARAWSFGASTERGGRTVHGGLLRFKSAFAPGCVVVPSFELDLQALPLDPSRRREA